MVANQPDVGVPLEDWVEGISIRVADGGECTADEADDLAVLFYDDRTVLYRSREETGCKAGKQGTFTINDGDTVVVSAAGYPDVTFVYNENVYVYAGLTWAEYWASEDVYNAGSTASSEEKDRRGESDLGAFDAVTRATANHGLHRGSFQAIAVLNGKTVSHWSADGKTVYYADGTSEVFNRNNVTGYTVTGLKYVPVEIKRADLAAFAESHAIVKNDRSEERRVGKECRSRWSPYH